MILRFKNNIFFCQLSPRGVNVNVIAPGVILTPMSAQFDQRLVIADIPQG